MDDKGAYTPFLQVQMAPFEDAGAYIYIHVDIDICILSIERPF